ncbi:MAG: SycD/LcrH family type III secretion system chaperone [Desulfovibrio sp.]|nr:SycD/LcrH family type III secretion system chaperone [Desulfovibrio sp.]
MTLQDTATLCAKHDEASVLSAIAQLSGLPLEEVKALYAKAIKEASLAKTFNIPEQSLETGYTMACNLLASGRYHDAQTMFRALCQYKVTVPKFWLGLGSCLEKLGIFREAVFCFAHAADLGEPLNPKPLYLLAQCCFSMQDVDAAKRALELAVVAGLTNDTEHQHYRTLAKEMLQQLPA